MKLVHNCIGLLTVCFFINVIPNVECCVLKSVSVVFRHGDRTPKKSEIYPNDPNHDYIKKIGYETLTDKGKKRLYSFGKSLKERYLPLLADKFAPSKVRAVSTDYLRTKISLRLLLAGLFSSTDNYGIAQQPDIPIEISRNNVSNFWNSDVCPRFMRELDKVTSTEDYKRADKFINKMGDQLKNVTGLGKISTYAINKLYHLFVAEESMNLKQPDWSKDYYPNGKLKDVALFVYKTYSFNTLLKRLNGGLFLQRIFHDMRSDELNKSSIHLYSAHGSNIAAILQTLNLWDNEVPKYGSAVIFELYEKNQTQFVKILYSKGVIPFEYKTLTVPTCGKFCLLEKIHRLTRHVIPAQNISDECSVD